MQFCATADVRVSRRPTSFMSYFIPTSIGCRDAHAGLFFRPSVYEPFPDVRHVFLARAAATTAAVTAAYRSTNWGK